MGALMKRVMWTAQLVVALSLAASWASAAFDPTAPPKSRVSSRSEASPEETSLAWVRVNGPHSIAWYGGAPVKLGDPVEGGRVTAIREDHIVISGRGGRRTVYLLDHSIRTQLRAHPRPAR